MLYLFPFVHPHFSEGKVHNSNIYLIDITKQVDCVSPEWLIFDNNIGKDRDRNFTGKFFWQSLIILIRSILGKKNSWGRLLWGVCCFILWIKLVRIHFLKITITRDIQVVLYFSSSLTGSSSFSFCFCLCALTLFFSSNSS